MCEFFSKTRSCPSQAKNIPTCQKSGISGRNLKVCLTQQQMIGMLRKLRPLVF